eukprot:jgi/Botrbrau1/1411/Bobra.0063s0107.2
MKSIVKALTPGKDGFRGTSLEATCQMATAKTLNAPDPDLNSQVVQVINSHRCSPQEILSVIKGRLGQKNPHKVYLAIVLIRQLLMECEHALAPVRSQIFAEIATIASTPMNRYGNDLHSQQQAKQAAYELLHNYNVGGEMYGGGQVGHGMGHHGHGHGHGHGHAHGHGDGPVATKAQRWEALKAATEKGIGNATTYADRMQELLIRYSSGSADSAEKARVKEQMQKLATDVAAFRTVMERVLAQLAGSDEEAAPVLTTRALEAVDIMNNAVAMQEEIVLSAEAGPTPAPAPRTVTLGEPQAANASVAAPPAGPALAVAFEPSPLLPVSPLDAVAELQEALDAMYVAPSPAVPNPQPVHPVQDPFSIRAPVHTTGNPFAASNINNLFYGPSNSQQLLAPSTTGSSEPSPFGPSAFAHTSTQAPAAAGSSAQLCGPPGTAFMAPLQPHQEPYGFSAPGTSAFQASTFFPSMAQGAASTTFSAVPSVQQPAEDAFAAIAQEALRSSPKSPKGPKSRGERGRTLSEGAEKAANESAVTEDARAPVSNQGPQGGLGTLYPTVDAGVPGVAVKEGPHVAVETLPGLSQQLPPLPEAPVAFEPKLGHEISSVNAQGNLDIASAVEAGPPKPLHPPVVVDTSSATPGTEQGASPPAEWDAFFADRLGMPTKAPDDSLLPGLTHSGGQPDPFQQLASERRTQST